MELTIVTLWVNVAQMPDNTFLTLNKDLQPSEVASKSQEINFKMKPLSDDNDDDDGDGDASCHFINFPPCQTTSS